MGQFTLLANGFLNYGVQYVIFIGIAVAGIFVGKKLRSMKEN